MSRSRQVHLEHFFFVAICTFVLEREDQLRVNSSLIHKTQISNYIYQQYFF